MEMLRQENLNLSGYQRSEKSIARSSPGLCLADWWWRRKGASHLYVDYDVMGYNQNKSFHRESKIIFTFKIIRGFSLQNFNGTFSYR